MEKNPYKINHRKEKLITNLQYYLYPLYSPSFLVSVFSPFSFIWITWNKGPKISESNKTYNTYTKKLRETGDIKLKDSQSRSRIFMTCFIYLFSKGKQTAYSFFWDGQYKYLPHLALEQMTCDRRHGIVFVSCDYPYLSLILPIRFIYYHCWWN